MSESPSSSIFSLDDLEETKSNSSFPVSGALRLLSTRKNGKSLARIQYGISKIVSSVIQEIGKILTAFAAQNAKDSKRLTINVSDVTKSLHHNGKLGEMFKGIMTSGTATKMGGSFGAVDFNINEWKRPLMIDTKEDEDDIDDVAIDADWENDADRMLSARRRARKKKQFFPPTPKFDDSDSTDSDNSDDSDSDSESEPHPGRKRKKFRLNSNSVPYGFTAACHRLLSSTGLRQTKEATHTLAVALFECLRQIWSLSSLLNADPSTNMRRMDTIRRRDVLGAIIALSFIRNVDTDVVKKISSAGLSNFLEVDHPGFTYTDFGYNSSYDDLIVTQASILRLARRAGAERISKDGRQAIQNLIMRRTSSFGLVASIICQLHGVKTLGYSQTVLALQILSKMTSKWPSSPVKPLKIYRGMKKRMKSTIAKQQESTRSAFIFAEINRFLRSQLSSHVSQVAESSIHSFILALEGSLHYSLSRSVTFNHLKTLTERSIILVEKNE